MNYVLVNNISIILASGETAIKSLEVVISQVNIAKNLQGSRSMLAQDIAKRKLPILISQAIQDIQVYQDNLFNLNQGLKLNLNLQDMQNSVIQYSSELNGPLSDYRGIVQTNLIKDILTDAVRRISWMNYVIKKMPI